MSKNIQHRHKQNLKFITLVLTAIFVLLNVSVLLISSNITQNKINEETEELLTLTRYLINDNDIEVAIEYIDHYSESHSVEIEIYSIDEKLLYSSKDETFSPVVKQLVTDKGSFTMYIDNSHSVTTDLYRDELINVNIIMMIIYFVTLTTLLYLNHRSSNRINKDIEEVLSLIKSIPNYNHEFYYTQFDDIHKAIWEYIDEIDLLRDKRDMNVKGLAHDIRTPLTIINSYIKHSEGMSKESANKSVEEINALVNELIDDKYIDVLKPINVTTIVKETVEKFNSIFETKDIEISLSVDMDLYTLWNKKELYRVLENIFSNAFYYSEEHTSFDITITSSENTIQLDFTSIGSPMSKTTICNIFKKGYRGDISFTRNTQGKGLGLYICKILLESVSGTIDVNSNDVGNTFTLKLKKHSES